MKSSRAAVLVTGGAGFIGSHLVRALVDRGFFVRILDDFSTGRKENLQGLSSSIRVIRARVEDAAAVMRAARDVERIYHLAAISSVPHSVAEPMPTGHANVMGTWNVLEAARRHQPRRIVFISSASVYGARTRVPFTETMSLRGSSPYAASKLIGEELCDLYGRLYGVAWTALRLFSVYGPRQNPRSQYANVIPAFATCLLSGRQPTIYGHGRQTRDFVFVGDVVRALMRAATKARARGQVINVGTGRQTSVVGLLRMIQSVLGTRMKPLYEAAKPGDDPRTCADTRRCKDLLGLAHITPLERGLARALPWFQEYSRSR